MEREYFQDLRLEGSIILKWSLVMGCIWSGLISQNMVPWRVLVTMMMKLRIP